MRRNFRTSAAHSTKSSIFLIDAGLCPKVGMPGLRQTGQQTPLRKVHRGARIVAVFLSGALAAS
jgi:hypothetical protein